jgi:hypothetical protein
MVPDNEDRKGEIRAMFSPNHVIVAAHIDELHAAAAAERLARSARPANSRNRIASALTSFWSILGGAEKSQPLPNLTDYPFRS